MKFSIKLSGLTIPAIRIHGNPSDIFVMFKILLNNFRKGTKTDYIRSLLKSSLPTIKLQRPRPKFQLNWLHPRKKENRSYKFLVHFVLGKRRRKRRIPDLRKCLKVNSIEGTKRVGDFKGNKKQKRKKMKMKITLKMKNILKKMNNQILELLRQNTKYLRFQREIKMNIKMLLLEILPMLLRRLWKKLTVRNASM